MLLRVATYNIHRCVGLDGIEDKMRIAAVLSQIDADIVALQEVTSHSKTADDVLAYLAEAVGMVPVEGFTLTADGAHYGNALLSRLPIKASRRIDISVKGREPRGVIQVELSLNNQRLVVWTTHLGLGFRERRIQTKQLLKVIDATQSDLKSDLNILLGDFNEWLPLGGPLSAIGQRFTTPKSPATFPSRRPFLKLDRIWLRPAKKIESLRTHSTKLAMVASDHLPLVMNISV